MKSYLDYNATTPLATPVRDAMLACMDGAPGNPSSTHQFGRAQRALIDTAREQVAQLVGAQPAQIIFTGGGTEANNLALHAVSAGQTPGRIVVSAVEHPSVLEAAQQMSKSGWQIDRLAVDAQCRVTGEALQSGISTDTRLVSVMMANNETGAIQDINAIADRAHSVGAVMHTDAVQAVGKLPVNFADSGAQLMSLSAHKIYGPQGVGALVFDKSLELTPMQYGGGQERGYRAGTENVAGIVGFGVAAELVLQDLDANSERISRLRDALEAGLGQFPQVTVFAQQAKRLPNTVQLAVAGIDGETLLMQLDRAGIGVSSGSACSSSSNEPSHVLMAMGVEADVARGAIRISLGQGSRQQDIDAVLGQIAQQLQWIQKAGQVSGW
ncbi:Cysteine desulfurase [hydrothermal vent metagenome]|uniref:Cysteine desulfurase n=1 Tax=hydrothermal vent metagenome TaxID=652676 RepID=A0A3B0Z6U7_9ZZZZ